PANHPDDEHVRVVPAAGSGVLLAARLLKTNAGHARPVVADVARHTPEMTTDFPAPLPHLASAVLTNAEHDVARLLAEDVAHQLVRLHAILERRHRRDLAVTAPVVLQVVEAPARVGSRVLLLVLPGRAESLAGRRTRRRVQTRLEAQRVNVVDEALHVREVRVGGRLTIRVPRAGDVAAAARPRIRLHAAFPDVINIDVGVARR